MAVGIVTNTEIEDATPAAMLAHTRRRAEYDRIVEQFFALLNNLLGQPLGQNGDHTTVESLAVGEKQN